MDRSLKGNRSIFAGLHAPEPRSKEVRVDTLSTSVQHLNDSKLDSPPSPRTRLRSPRSLHTLGTAQRVNRYRSPSTSTTAAPAGRPEPFTLYSSTRLPHSSLSAKRNRSAHLPSSTHTRTAAADPRIVHRERETIPSDCGSRAANSSVVEDLPPLAGSKRSLQVSAFQASHKRLRLPELVLSPRKRHALELTHLPSAQLGASPPSPLFFSNSTPATARPSLPPRFSSSEAAATMLSKTNSEERHMKTVTLARGSVSSPGQPPTSTPMRSSSDRSSLQDTGSPTGHLARRASSTELLGALGVAELLEQDDRPTLIIDLGDPLHYAPGPIVPIFVNSALRACPGLYELLSGTAPVTPLTEQDERQDYFLRFKSWLLGAAPVHESPGICLPRMSFARFAWSSSTLRKRLRVIAGTPETAGSLVANASRDIISAPAAVDEPQVPFTAHESKDYFGEAAATAIMPGLSAQAEAEKNSAPPSDPSRQSLASTPGSLPDRTADRISISDLSPSKDVPCFDWTRLPITDDMPSHIRFARSIDWASTSLGPIQHWPQDLRQMCNLIMASPHPAAMYWGEDFTAIYNEAYVLLAGQKHPALMGQSYRLAWAEIWDEVKDFFSNARLAGESTMKDDDCLFIRRNDFLEETYFSWSIIPIVGNDGSVSGLYNPAFEKTRRKIAERRMLTLREIGERTASARDMRGFWREVISALDLNEYDTPFVLLYSVAEDADSDASSMCSFNNASNQVLQCTLEGSLGVAEEDLAAPRTIDLKTGMEGFGPIFREVMRTHKPLNLEIGSEHLPHSLLAGLERRGFGDPCSSVVVCPMHPTTGETTLGFLVLGVNPRRPYDEDYSLFVQLLSRQLATSLASVVLFEEEIRRGQKAARLAALDRLELSEQLAARTQEAIDSETKFTRMAEFAPVGMFIANTDGEITYSNDQWFQISRISKSATNLTQRWMDAIKDEDKQTVSEVWHDLMVRKKPTSSTFRFNTPWQDPDGTVGECWVLFSAYPEKHETGELKCVFGSFTDISKQKWAEGFQKRKMEEAVELKRQQENFIDMTSHEMRNPLSAILQCADEVTMTMTRFRDKYALKKPSHDELLLDKRQVDDMGESVASTLDAAQTIALCAQHQKRIVDDILTLSKLDSQLLLVTPVDAQPLTVAQRALKMHEGELQSNDINLDFHVLESFKKLNIDWVRFDPSRVLQVLINLTTNAIKFTTPEQKRTITVSIGASLEKPSVLEDRVVSFFPSRRPERADAREDAEWGVGEIVYVYFAVRDTGRGLGEDEKKMLFLRFSQASPRTHVQYGGSGLGLFISRELTELQGGQIGVASESGKGSTFAFYVKARRSKEPASADGLDASTSNVTAVASLDDKSLELKKRIATKTKHILLVEDNLVNQRVLQKQLKNLGCVVHVANHGGEALDKLRASRYWVAGPEDKISSTDRVPISVVLMDQEMPVMDGLTATREIRDMEDAGRLVSHVPVIAVTANARSEQIQTALDAGMDDVVSKPFRIPDLIPKIEELMARYPEPDE